MSVVLELIAQLRELQADDFFGDWARELADHLEWRISEPQHDAFDLPDSGDPERDRSALADWLQRAADAPPFLAPSWTRNFSEGVAWLVRHERTVTHQALMAAASQTRQWSVPPEWSDPPPELLTPRSMTTVETPQADLSGAALSVMVLFAACVGIALRLAWNPPIKTYVEYLPIGAVFAGLIWDRLFPVSSAPCTALCDAAVVILAGIERSSRHSRSSPDIRSCPRTR
jgi:hypothetical protein